MTIHTQSIKHSNNMRRLQINELKIHHDSLFASPEAGIHNKKAIIKSAIKGHLKAQNDSNTNMKKLQAWAKEVKEQISNSSQHQHQSKLGLLLILTER